MEIEGQIQQASAGLIAVVTDENQLASAVARIQRLKAIKDAFLEEKNKSVSEAHALHKRLVGERDVIVNRIDGLCAEQNAPIRAYQDAIAAMQRRIEAERLAEQERLLEQAKKAKTPEKKRELKALAKALPESPVLAPKAEGLSQRELIEITDINAKEICRQVAEGKLPVTVIAVQIGTLQKLASTLNLNGKQRGWTVKRSKINVVRKAAGGK